MMGPGETTDDKPAAAPAEAEAAAAPDGPAAAAPPVVGVQGGTAPPTRTKGGALRWCPPRRCRRY